MAKSKYKVYTITNILNNKKYVGITTVEIEKRLLQHFNRTNRILRSAFNKYGKHNFKIECVYIAFDIDSLMNAEKQLIKDFNTLVPNGYNLTSGGEHHECSDDTRKYFSKIKTDLWKNEELKNNHSKIMKEYYQKNPNKIVKKLHKLIDGVNHKQCYNCEKWKILDLFGYSDTSWDKKSRECRACSLQRSRLFNGYSGNVKIKKEKLYIKQNKEWAQSYVDRKESISKGVSDYYQKNPESKLNLSIKKCKPIMGTHVETGEIITFSSALAAKSFGFNNSNIGQAIKMNRVYKNYIWKFMV